jgi:hypothetical protein
MASWWQVHSRCDSRSDAAASSFVLGAKYARFSARIWTSLPFASAISLHRRDGSGYQTKQGV